MYSRVEKYKEEPEQEYQDTFHVFNSRDDVYNNEPGIALSVRLNITWRGCAIDYFIHTEGMNEKRYWH